MISKIIRKSNRIFSLQNVNKLNDILESSNQNCLDEKTHIQNCEFKYFQRTFILQNLHWPSLCFLLNILGFHSTVTIET